MANVDELVTGIVVTYNTKDIFQRAYDSVRRFYPTMRIIVIDNSTKNNDCYQYVDLVGKHPHTDIVHTESNIGHGPAMHQAILMSKTKYVLVFDSDIHMNRAPLAEMLALMRADTYGVGMFDNVCKDGYYHKGDPHALRIPYLHPFFQLIQVESYHKFPPFVHHGSPCIHTMVDIYNRGLSKKILKAFPVGNYVKHYWRGTRKLNPKEFLRNWETSRKPFLSIVTRHHPRRPFLFRQHKGSLEQQRDQDFEHVVLVDEVGRGVPWANGMFYRERHQVKGDYVFILDDDDVLITDTFVEDMKQIVVDHSPDIIMIRGFIRDRLYPTEEVWQKEPKFAHIGSFNFVVKRDLWLKHIKRWDIARGGDFNFIRDAYKDAKKVFWQDEVYSKTVVVSRGADEPGYEERKSVPKGAVTVITCTGDRPEAFELCKKWMERQTRKPDQWVVVDDGKTPIVPCDGMDYFYRMPSDKDPPHTLCRNLNIGLSLALYDNIIIMEDDDWYAPEYIEYMLGLLQRGDLVGIENLLFYNLISKGYNEKGRAKQPPLAQTAFTRKVFPAVQNLCRNAEQFPEIWNRGLIDVYLWQTSEIVGEPIQKVILTASLKLANSKVLTKGMEFTAPNIPASLIRRAQRNKGAVFANGVNRETFQKLRVVSPSRLVVGMKGVPGRKGLTSAQNPDNGKLRSDHDLKVLKSLIGRDVGLYKDMGGLNE